VEAIGQLTLDRRNEARFTFQYNLKDTKC